MSELQQAEGPKNWAGYLELRDTFTVTLVTACDALVDAAISDGAKKADAMNAVVHELLHFACFAACINAAESLGRDPSLDQWQAVTNDIFERTAKALKAADTAAPPTEGGAS